MNDKAQILARLRLAIPRLEAQLTPETRLDSLGADSIDLVELFVAVDTDFGVRLSQEEFRELTTVDDLLRLIAERSEEAESQ